MTDLHYSEAPGEARWLVRRRGIPQYMGDLKVCRRCELVKDPADFPTSKHRADGRYPYCRACQAASNAAVRARDPERARAQARQYTAKRRATPSGRATDQAYRRAHAAESRRRRLATEDGRRRERARYRVSKAVRDGRLIKPSSCSECGSDLPPARLHAHHWRGYDGPAALDVEWLCARCHGSRHRHSYRRTTRSTPSAG